MKTRKGCGTATFPVVLMRLAGYRLQDADEYLPSFLGHRDVQIADLALKRITWASLSPLEIHLCWKVSDQAIGNIRQAIYALQ